MAQFRIRILDRPIWSGSSKSKTEALRPWAGFQIDATTHYQLTILIDGSPNSADMIGWERVLVSINL